MERAIAGGVEAICLFTAATDGYAQHNIQMTVAESLATFAPLAAEAHERGWWVRGYLSTAFGCPYEGEVDVRRVVEVAEALLALGVDELSVSDTVGMAAPADVRRVVGALAASGIAGDRLALHLHDTRGTALANVVTALELGIRTFDASTGGTGGSPFAPGAAGNLATEDLVYLLDREGLRHGVDLDAVLTAARFIADALGQPLASKVGRAGGWPR
jgi:isopropylmalate/homocitrate/citramalate synthase